MNWFCCAGSQDIASITEVSTTLQQELKSNAEELEVKSRKNVEMTYVLSVAIPTLRDLLNSVSVTVTAASPS